MATKDQAYDHPAYQARFTASSGEAGGAATTQYSKFAAFAAMKAMSVQFTVTTAGTAAGHLFSVIKISGTATSTLATSTLGTLAAGTTRNVALSTASGGADVAQGDILAVISGADVVGKAAVGFELQVAPLAPVTL